MALLQGLLSECFLAPPVDSHLSAPEGRVFFRGFVLLRGADDTLTGLLTICGKSRFARTVTVVARTHASPGPCTRHQGTPSVPLSWVLVGTEPMLAAGMVEPILCPLRLGMQGNSFQ